MLLARFMHFKSFLFNLFSYVPLANIILFTFVLLKKYFFLVSLGPCCCERVFFSCGAPGFSCGDFSCCGSQALGAQPSVVADSDSVAVALGLPCSRDGKWALVALRHVESSQTRYWIHVAVLTGRFLSTIPPGKSLLLSFKKIESVVLSVYYDVFLLFILSWPLF